MRRARQEEWELDVGLRQLNVVFPDTAANEARFWRNILSGRQKLGAAQIVGIALIYITVAAAIYGLISTRLQVSNIRGPMWERAIGNFEGWIILLVIAGVVLLAGQLMSRRSQRFGKPSLYSTRKK